MKFIKKVTKTEIYKYSEVPGFVELWDFSRVNVSQEAREEVIATVASLSYGNERAKNPKGLWNHLKRRGHTSVFEFIRFPKEVEGELIDFDISSSLRNKEFPTVKDSGSDVDKAIEVFRKTLAVFKVKVPLFVRSQYHRHRSFSYLEMSRRYVRPDKVSFEFWNPSGYSEIQKEFNKAVVVYRQLINAGYKPEVARSIIPQAVYTKFWVMKDYVGARNYFVERFSRQAQEQIREVAHAQLKLLFYHQPEFLGQYVTVIGTETSLFETPMIRRILQLADLKNEVESEFLIVEFGDKNYYARFNLKHGLFDEKLEKNKYEL